MIGPRQSEELWNFYSRFVDCPRGRFMSGIAHADEIYRLRGPCDELLGFAALQTIEVEVDGKRRHVVCGAAVHGTRHRNRCGLPAAGD